MLDNKASSFIISVTLLFNWPMADDIKVFVAGCWHHMHVWFVALNQVRHTLDEFFHEYFNHIYHILQVSTDITLDNFAGIHLCCMIG